MTLGKMRNLGVHSLAIWGPDYEPIGRLFRWPFAKAHLTGVSEARLRSIQAEGYRGLREASAALGSEFGGRCPRLAIGP